MLQTMDKIQHSIMHNVRETTDEFIFRTISDWLEDTKEIHVSKAVIIRALQCFMTEHEEEYKELTKND